MNLMAYCAKCSQSHLFTLVKLTRVGALYRGDCHEQLVVINNPTKEQCE